MTTTNEDTREQQSQPVQPRRRADALQAWLGRALFAGAVLMLLLVVFAAKFDSLRDEFALRHADVARNLATGRGLRSLSVQPLSFALAGDQPDRVLYSAPAYPVVLAGALRLFGVTDRAVALTALIFLLLTIALTFFIALRIFNERTAIAAVAVLVLTVPVLQHVVAGTEIPFLALLVTGLFGLLMWWSQSPRQDSDWWPIAAGVIVTIAWLTRYEMAVLLPMVVVFWLHGERRRRARRLLWTVLPFLLVAGLWTVRNSTLTGRPLVSPWAYYLLADTSLYPHTVITRLYQEFPAHPWAIALDHPGMMAQKVTRYLRQLYYAIPMLGNPFVTMFFLVGTVIATARREWALVHWSTVLAMGLTVPVLCIYLRTPSVLICFVPIVSILAVRKLIEILEGISPARAPREWDGAITVATRLRVWLGLIGRETGGPRLIAFGVVMLVLLAGYPLLDYLFLQPPPQRTPLIGAAQTLGKLDYRLVMSNVPEALSWYGGLHTVGVPSSAVQLKAMREAGIVPDAIYLAPTPAALQIRFQGYERVERPGVQGLLWEPVGEDAATGDGDG